MRRIVLLTIPIVLLVAPVRGAEPPPELDALFKKAVAFRPNASDFSWREIPWHEDPAAALKEARDEKRPLLVWLAGGRDRDGTPLDRC